MSTKYIKHDVPLRLCKILNVLIMTMAFEGVWLLSYKNLIESPFYFERALLMFVLFITLYLQLGRTYDAFKVSLCSISEMIYSQFLAVLMTDAMMYVIVVLLSMRIVSIIPLVILLFSQLMLAITWSILAHKWYFTVFPPKKSAIIFDVRKGMEKLVKSYGYEKKYDVIINEHVDTCLKDLSMLDVCDVVYLSGIHSKERNIILKYCLYHDIDVFVIPRVGDVIMSSADKMHMFHLPVLRVTRYEPAFEYAIFKRAFDIFCSLSAIILLSPFMLITAIAIKSDGGPCLYKQKRLTKNGKVFEVWKFRSMRVDAEKDGVARLSTGDNDDRITPVGKIIRKIRFDELPQLFNILRGEMTIVGPRPERPEIAAEYEKEMPEFKLRLQCKAGLTGYAQVYGKYNTTPYDKLQMDLMYIASASILEDIRICFATVKILFMPESTEGVEEGQTTAMSKAS